MSLEAIISRVRTDAEAEAEAIRQDAQRELREAEEAHRKRVEEKYARELERLRGRILDRRKRMEFHITRESDRELLNARRALMDRAINEAVEKLTSLDDAEYMKLIDALIEACDLEGNVEVMIAETDSKRITAEYLKERSTREMKLALAEERHGDVGGVVFRSDKISQNATFSMIASLAHEEMIMKLAPLVPVDTGD